MAAASQERRSGVLVVDKPRGRTSHDVVAEARRFFKTRAVGHAGTLDPMATGVLVLLFGEACKLSAHLTADDKAYRAGITFGVATDSLDADGSVTETRELPPGWLEEAPLDAALATERARTLQVPPSVSAIQTGGERAYARVRRGEAVTLEPRPVTLESVVIVERDPAGHRVTCELRVSKGYYVRAFARDLGAALGVPAHLSSLRRLASGAFTLADAHAWPPDASLAPTAAHAEPPFVTLAEAAKKCLPVTELSAAGTERARRGQRLAPGEAAPGAIGRVCVWLSPGGEAVALGISSASGEHRVVRGLNGAHA